MKPSVTRTPFVAVDAPAILRIWFCPACGRQINGSYNIDSAKKSCTKTWHLASAVPRTYVLARPADEGEAGS